MSTSNPFAIVLVFYFNFIRSKLNPEDLLKIQKKYAKKPDRLVHDLKTKYQFEIPQNVSETTLLRILANFTIPETFIALTGFDKSIIPQYNVTIDVASEQFDADVAFKNGIIIASDPNLQPFDNMTKIAHLIPGNEAHQQIVKSTENTSKKRLTKSNREKPVIERRHLFDILAQQASFVTIRTDLGEVQQVASPVSLLEQFMRNKDRIRIITRRQYGIRGSIDGYILAFDKHFNILLNDCDEEYLMNRVSEQMHSNYILIVS
jgi:small nuclear ribonucleoprotein (snRNP)-like protein